MMSPLVARGRIVLRKDGNVYRGEGKIYEWPFEFVLERNENATLSLTAMDKRGYEPIPIIDGFGPVYGPEPSREPPQRRRHR